MDEKLVSWARAVKARRDRGRTRGARTLPVLFFFTDRRVPDAAAVVRSLGARRGGRLGLFGVVVRGARAEQERQLRVLAPLCRRHAIALLVSGDARLAASHRAGLHLPGGRRSVVRTRPRSRVTASAHGVAGLRRARLAGAALCFVSPVFPTRSHPGAPTLGPVRLARLLHTGGHALQVAALGGVDGAAARALPRGIAGAGAIDAFLGA